MSNALPRALALADAGYYVFPSWAKNRHVAGWPQRATRDRATIEQWFTGQYSDCQPSVLTGRFGDGSKALLVVDVDPRGMDTAKGLNQPRTRVHRTPRGGRHCIYTVPFPGVKSGTNVLADGIDIRSKGGLIHFGEGYSVEDAAVPIAEAPAWLVERCSGLAPITSPADRAEDRLSSNQEFAFQRGEDLLRSWPEVSEGGRNVALRDFVYRVRETCGTDAANTVALGLEFAARCVPPYPEDEARATIASAIRSAQNPAGARAASADDFSILPEAAPTNVTPRSRVKFMASVAPVQTAPYLVKGVLGQGAYAAIYGPPGAGKSTVALSIAYHVAAGLEWMGRKTRQGLVLYVGFEAYSSLEPRLVALRQTYGADAPLAICAGGFDVRTPEGKRLFGEILAELPESPKLIVFDTLAYALGGGDENEGKDIGAFNSAAQALIERTGATLLVIHHTGKDKAKGLRGHSSLNAALDTALLVDDRTISQEKQRSIMEGPPIGFALRPVVVGVDEDGEAVTACAVEPAQVAASNKRALSDAEQVAMAALEQVSPTNEPAFGADLKRRFKSRAYPGGEPKADTALKAYNRAMSKLETRGLIERVNDDQWRRKFAAVTDSPASAALFDPVSGQPVAQPVIAEQPQPVAEKPQPVIAEQPQPVQPVAAEQPSPVAQPVIAEQPVQPTVESSRARALPESSQQKKKQRWSKEQRAAARAVREAAKQAADQPVAVSEPVALAESQPVAAVESVAAEPPAASEQPAIDFATARKAFADLAAVNAQAARESLKSAGARRIQDLEQSPPDVLLGFAESCRASMPGGLFD